MIFCNVQELSQQALWIECIHPSCLVVISLSKVDQLIFGMKNELMELTHWFSCYHTAVDLRRALLIMIFAYLDLHLQQLGIASNKQLVLDVDQSIERSSQH